MYVYTHVCISINTRVHMYIYIQYLHILSSIYLSQLYYSLYFLVHMCCCTLIYYSLLSVYCSESFTTIFIIIYVLICNNSTNVRIYVHTYVKAVTAASSNA